VSTTSVVPGLGWPDSPDATPPTGSSTGLGWPAGAEAHRQVSREAAEPRPAQTRVLVVANQKGGVGKTTTAVNIAAALSEQGQRVLVLDLDPQGNASTALSIDHAPGTKGVYEALIDGEPLDTLLRESPEHPGLYVVPATVDLAGAEIELVTMPRRESRLRELVAALLSPAPTDRGFDFVLVDCPPSLGLLTVNALVAAREVLIPVQCEYYALEGLGQLLKTVERVREHLNPELHVSTVLLTMYDARTRLAAEVAEDVRRHFAGAVLETVVPRSVRISEAPSYGRTVLSYDPASPGATAYREAARELARGDAQAQRTYRKRGVVSWE
jgi:chromosome partitioning protein